MIHLSLYDPAGISYWNRNLPHCWVWSSAVPDCPVACSWKTLGWQTSRWTPSSPPCYHSRSSCGLQGDGEDMLSLSSTNRFWWCGRKEGNQRVLTRSSEGDAEVCDGQQLRCVDAISSQQLHKISWFCTTRHGPLWSIIQCITVNWLGRVCQRL